MAKATIGIMAVTMISKILGFVRELILGYTYGASVYTDAYITSMNIPIAIFATIGAALSTTFIPLYYEVKVKVQQIDDNANSQMSEDVLAIVIDDRYKPDEFNKLLQNGFYVHGRSGIFDEINYFDNNPDTQIKPTFWYNKQEPFEFEFVVSQPTGLHKIFNNLVIISNNVQPKELEFEIIGDVYDFKKSGIFKDSSDFKNTSVKYDHILNQYTLVTNQKCKNIEEFGRRIGNIQYKEDSWYTTIEPIIHNNQSARIRDKFIKIRVKYNGEDQVIITALKTLFTLSYS